jgi:hypothetical protein
MTAWMNQFPPNDLEKWTPIFETLSLQTNGQGKLEMLPGLISQRLSMLGFESKDIEDAKERIESLMNTIDQMGLADENDNTSNLVTSYAMLFLLEQKH